MVEPPEFLKPCKYRQFEANSLVCTITTQVNDHSTNLTSVEACSGCPVPDISAQVNCTHLHFSKQHLRISGYLLEGMSETRVGDVGWTAQCKVIQFTNKNDYLVKCSEACPKYNPIHRNLASEEPIRIASFDATTASDRNLRQGVLTVLYGYHARHPERYSFFDVTPEFIAQSLGIYVQDVIRVVAPMEEEGEVDILKFETDRHFSYVRITSRGIQMIDEEPLFKRLDTAGIRIMGDQFNFDRSPVGAINAGSNNQNQADVHQEFAISSTELSQAFNDLRQQVESLPLEQRQEAVGLVAVLEDQAKLGKVDKSLVEAYGQKLVNFLGNAAANTVGTIVAALLMAV
jgi:hypothetical protein